ncbi:MAG: hypothetical protein AAF518_28980, partial [Spirochaetota bacterium]
LRACLKTLLQALAASLLCKNKLILRHAVRVTLIHNEVSLFAIYIYAAGLHKCRLSPSGRKTEV